MFLSLAPLLVLACGTDKKADDSGAGVVMDAFPVSAELSAVIPTVPTVTWSSDDVASAWVRYGIDGDFGDPIAVDLEGGPPYATPVLGMKPGTTYSVRVEAESSGGQTLYSEETTVTTGSAPADLPTINTEVVSGSGNTPGFYVTSLMAQSTAVILDKDGDLVWWFTIDEYDQLGRVRLSVDGESVLMADVNLFGEEEAEIVRVSLDGTQVDTISTPYRHHDFVEHEDGTLAWMAFDPQVIDGKAFSGDRLWELAPGGEPELVFDVLDFHDPVAGAIEGTGSDWPHANAIDIVPDQDGEGYDYLISYLYMGGAARVDRATVTEEWFLGGDESTLLTPEGEIIRIDRMHGMDLAGDNLMIFENGTGSSSSRVRSFDLDVGNGTATEVWEYSADPTLSSPVFGDVSRFDSGNLLITFSYNGVIHEVDPQGELLWQVTTSLGGAFCFVTWMPGLQAQ